MPRLAALVALVTLVGLASSAAAADDPVPVTVRFLGGAKKVPLEGLKLTVRANTGNWTADKANKLAAGTTDKAGTAAFSLSPGRYYIDTVSDKELPYLRHPIGYKGNSTHYHRQFAVVPHADHALTFTLSDGCRLVLRAVDADTGKPVPGVGFATENAPGEMWADDIFGDNLGAKKDKAAAGMTDENGTFTRLIGPRPGYTYFPWKLPTGYERADGTEVELPSPVGTEKVEHVFKLRKKK